MKDLAQRNLSCLHVIGSDLRGVGGHTYSAAKLCAALAEEGVRVRLFALGDAPVERRPSFSQSFRHDLSKVPVASRLRLAGRMRAAIRRDDADVFHVHGLWTAPGLYAASTARRSARPIIVSPHGMLSAEALRVSRLAKLVFGPWQAPLLAGADLFHATSEQEAEDCRRLFPKTPIALVPLGIDVPASRAKSSPRRADERVALYLGRLHPIKGLDRLIAAWRIVETFHPSWRLKIVGPDEGGYGERLRRISAGSRRIDFQGAVGGAERERLFGEASLFILPSLSENFGITVLEALASGVPVLASNATPWAELEDRRCGWRAEPTACALAAALQEILGTSPATLTAMGERGRTWVAQSFTWSQIGRRMADVYRWLAEGAPQPQCVT